MSTIEEQHWRMKMSTIYDEGLPNCTEAKVIFDRLVEENRSRFMPVEGGRVYGAIIVKAGVLGWLSSPREKGSQFTSADATLVTSLDWPERLVYVAGVNASLNAPLLIKYAVLYGLDAVVHFHEQIEGLPTLPYAPPGTERDNNRELPAGVLRDGFNIEGHGCVLPIYEYGE